MVDHWSRSVSRVLADNPSPMTLDGTNTLLVRHPDSSGVVVIDPGPLEEAHLRELDAAGPVELILLTHRHTDHAAAAPRLHEATGAPVRAADAALCAGGGPLGDREVIEAGGCRIEVISAPGHTDDSVCFVLADDGVILTGDTILGRGTSVIAPTGSLRDYIATLERLRTIGGGGLRVLPAHGDPLPDLADAAERLVEHRRMRLQEVRDALCRLGMAASTDRTTVGRVADLLYGDVDARIRYAAEMSVTAQLEHLAAE